MSFTLVVLSGVFHGPDGQPANGHVTFQLSHELSDGSGTILSRAPKVATLDGSGAFSISLEATDDPSTSPPGQTYQVTEQIGGAPSRTYQIVLPSANPSCSLAALAPARPLAASAQYVLSSVFASAFAATERTANKGQPSGYASLDSGGKVPLGQIPALPETDVTNLVADLAAEVSNRSAAVSGEASARSTADALLIPLAQRGAANGVATLDSGAKIPAAQLPALAINEIYTVASQAAMLALAANPGDIAIRTDVGSDFQLAAAPASTLGNWVELAFKVTSVFGRTGAVTLAKADVTGTGLAASDVGADVAGAAAAEASARASAVSSEANTRAAADTANASAISAETSRAMAAEAVLQTGTTLASVTAQSRKLDRTLDTVSSGSWCWFNGPTIVDHQGTYSKRYFGYADPNGNVMVGSLDLTSGAIVTFDLHAAFAFTSATSPSNDHSSPSIAVRPDGRIVVFYATQSGSALYYRISTNPEDVSSFGAEQTIASAGTLSTYPRPHYIGSRLFVFHNCSPTWRVVYSDDNGTTWSNPQLWHSTSPNPGGYIQTRTNPAQTRMDFIYSMHPNASGAGYASLSSMYHGYFDGTSFCKTDGTVLTTLAALPAVSNPNVATQTGGLTLTSLSLVYSYLTNGLCWAWDVAVGTDGNPVCVFASFPLAAVGDTWNGGQAAHFQDHRANYYRWNGAAWAGGQVATMGTKISDDYNFFQEYQYSGGIALLQSDPSVCFISRQVSPSLQWEIERWVTADGGTTWTSSPVTVESDPLTKNIRPMTAYNPAPGSPEVHWMRGGFLNYTNFATVLALSGPPTLAQIRSTLAARPTSAGLTDPLLNAAKTLSPSLLLPLAADLNDISGVAPATGNTSRVLSLTAPTFGTGRLAGTQALTFDGTQCLHTLIQPFVAGQLITFFGWANRSSTTNNNALFGSDDAGGANTHAGLRVNSGGEDVQFWANVAASAGAGSATWTAAWPGLNQWVHWALVIDMTGNTVELFINGASKGSVAYTTAWGSVANYLEIGHRGNFYATTPPDRWQGSLGLFGYVNSKLTATQIMALAGLSATNSHQDLKLQGLGRKAETIDFDLVDSSITAALVSGTLVAKLIPLKVTDGPITGLQLFSSASGATASATLVKAQILDSTFHVRATSADFSGSLAGGTVNLVPFTALYYPAADGSYYAAVLMVFSGTAPQMPYRGNASAAGVSFNGGLKSTLVQSGLADVLGVGSAYGSLVAGTRGWWLAAY